MMRGFVTFRPESSRTRLHLICAPYAGGAAAAFRGWARWLPEEIALLAIEFPGHGSRFAEPPTTSMSALVAEAADALAPITRAPLAFFGHSLGAVVMFELARKLHKQAGRWPERLLLSGQRAFHRPPPRPPIHALPDQEFLEEIRRYGGTPNEVFEDAELLSIFHPLLRSDFTLGETYCYEPGAPLECPISAYGGLYDLEVTSEDVKAWQSYTRREFNWRMFPGGHFFIHDCEELLVNRVLQDLQML